MTIELYTAGVDTAILIWLIGWALLERYNIYFGKSK